MFGTVHAADIGLCCCGVGDLRCYGDQLAVVDG